MILKLLHSTVVDYTINCKLSFALLIPPVLDLILPPSMTYNT